MIKLVRLDYRLLHGQLSLPAACAPDTAGEAPVPRTSGA